MPEREPVRAAAEISSFVDYLTRLGGLKAECVPEAGRGAEGGVGHPVLDDDSVIRASTLTATVITGDAVVAVPTVSSVVDAPGAVSMGHYTQDFGSSGTLVVVIIRSVRDVPPGGELSV